MSLTWMYRLLTRMCRPALVWMVAPVVMPTCAFDDATRAQFRTRLGFAHGCGGAVGEHSNAG